MGFAPCDPGAAPSICVSESLTRDSRFADPASPASMSRHVTPEVLRLLVLVAALWQLGAGPDLTRVRHNHPGLVVDPGVGPWAWPHPPKRAAPRFLEAGGARVRIQAGVNGSIQAPPRPSGAIAAQLRPRGASGRRKLAVVDWDGDGRLDVLVNSKSVDWFRNLGERDGATVLQWQGPLSNMTLAGHTTSPTTVDWDRGGVRDLLIGAEDGFLYFRKRPRAGTAGR